MEEKRERKTWKKKKKKIVNMVVEVQKTNRRHASCLYINSILLFDKQVCRINSREYFTLHHHDTMCHIYYETRYIKDIWATVYKVSTNLLPWSHSIINTNTHWHHKTKTDDVITFSSWCATVKVSIERFNAHFNTTRESLFSSHISQISSRAEALKISSSSLVHCSEHSAPNSFFCIVKYERW